MRQWSRRVWNDIRVQLWASCCLQWWWTDSCLRSGRSPKSLWCLHMTLWSAVRVGSCRTCRIKSVCVNERKAEVLTVDEFFPWGQSSQAKSSIRDEDDCAGCVSINNFFVLILKLRIRKFKITSSIYDLRRFLAFPQRKLMSNKFWCTKLSRPLVGLFLIRGLKLRETSKF